MTSAVVVEQSTATHLIHMESEVCKYFASFCGADKTSATVIDLSWSVFYERDQFKSVPGLDFTDLAPRAFNRALSWLPRIRRSTACALKKTY